MAERLRWWVARARLRGRAVTCPCCGWRGRRWHQPGQRCPRCRSFARHRFLAVALDRFGRPPSAAGVLLHVGSGPVDLAYLRRAGARVSVRVDLHHEEGDVVGTLGALPVRDRSVDLAVAWHVFEHVPDDVGAARDLARTLAPTGAAVVSVPFFPPDRVETVEAEPGETAAQRLDRHGDADHVRSCGADYGDRLAQAGWGMATLRVDELPTADQERWGLSDQHVAWCFTPAQRSMKT